MTRYGLKGDRQRLGTALTYAIVGIVFGSSSVWQPMKRFYPEAGNVNWFLRNMAIILVVLAVAFSGVLLAKDAGMEILPQLPLHLISAVSLLLVGLAYLLIQPAMGLRPKELLKNMLLASTFILWGIVQLMPQNVLSMRLDNLVVALFVLDLAGAAFLGVRSTQESVQPRAGPTNRRESRQTSGRETNVS